MTSDEAAIRRQIAQEISAKLGDLGPYLICQRVVLNPDITVKDAKVRV